MSIHARLNPEAQSNLDAQRRASVITSLVIAVLSIVLVILILFFILLPSLEINSPTIVAYSAGSEEEDPLQEKRITREVTPKPNAPSSAMAKVMASSTPTDFAVLGPLRAAPLHRLCSFHRVFRQAFAGPRRLVFSPEHSLLELV